jgi:ribosomal protein S18 acetylase RimI-like enzyme
VENIEMASAGNESFCNMLTGEFGYLSDWGDSADSEVFSDRLDSEDGWLRLPNQRDADEYDMMLNFAYTLKSAKKRDRLEIALSGKGAFRRFKDEVIREGVEEEWYSFRDRRYLEFARDWCDENDIPYDSSELPPEDEEIPSNGLRLMNIRDYFDVYCLWESAPGICLNDADDSLDGIARYLDRNPNTCFVYEENDTVVGAILAGHDGRRGYLRHICVAESHRRRGIGRELVNAAMTALKAEGISKTALVVVGQNEPGNAFWEHLGFELRTDLNYRDKTM